jgi:mycothiol synthase
MTSPASRIRRPAPADLEAIVDLLNACDIADTGAADTTTRDLENDWTLDGFDLASDAWLATDESGRIVGYAYAGDQLHTGALEADFWVHPDHLEPGLAERLLALAERRADELARDRGYGPNASLGIFAITTSRAKGEALRRHGFAATRTIYRMAADLTPMPPVTPPPPGITIRPFRPETDIHVMHAAMKEAFADHFWRSSEPFEAWKTRLVDHADFDPSLWYLAWDGEEAAGGLVAYDHGDLGWIKGLGVRRPWRRRGVAIALLTRAFAELARRGQGRVELGVDAAGATRPLRVYERAGMHVTFAYEAYSKPLAAPGVSSP